MKSCLPILWKICDPAKTNMFKWHLYALGTIRAQGLQVRSVYIRVGIYVGKIMRPKVCFAVLGKHPCDNNTIIMC